MMIKRPLSLVPFSFPQAAVHLVTAKNVVREVFILPIIVVLEFHTMNILTVQVLPWFSRMQHGAVKKAEKKKKKKIFWGETSTRVHPISATIPSSTL